MCVSIPLFTAVRWHTQRRCIYYVLATDTLPWSLKMQQTTDRTDIPTEIYNLPEQFYTRKWDLSPQQQQLQQQQKQRKRRLNILEIKCILPWDGMHTFVRAYELVVCICLDNEIHRLHQIYIYIYRSGKMLVSVSAIYLLRRWFSMQTRLMFCHIFRLFLTYSRLCNL